MGSPPFSRAALQASFQLPGKTDNNTIWNEINFGPVGWDTFFGVQLFQTVHDELPDTDPKHLSSSYQVTGAPVALSKAPNATNSFVGISFAFQTLSIEENEFSVQFTLEKFFGNFA